jgi:hypothetical protein
MQLASQIKDAYDWAMRHHQADTAAALASNDHAKITQLDKVRDAIDRGVYVLLFGQFEIAVTDKFARARDRRSTNLDWTQRRGWDMSSLKHRKVPFETRLALTLDSNTTAFKNAMAAYENRNHCAHGGMSAAVGPISQLYADIWSWNALLRGS